VTSLSGQCDRDNSDVRETTTTPTRRKEKIMEIGLGILTFGTLGFAVAFGYVSARSTEKQRLQDTRKSALSADGIAERIKASQS
jgi:hypothetical protein